jgi:hypothetical protein
MIKCGKAFFFCHDCDNFLFHKNSVSKVNWFMFLSRFVVVAYASD